LKINSPVCAMFNSVSTDSVVYSEYVLRYEFSQHWQQLVPPQGTFMQQLPTLHTSVTSMEILSFMWTYSKIFPPPKFCICS